MSIISELQRFFSPPTAGEADSDDINDSEWGQNFRIVVAILFTIVSAMIVWWMMS